MPCFDESLSINSDVAVLITSCDKYRDLWEPFFMLFWRYWPDCPYPIYLISNYKHFKDKRVNMITVGKDRKWASNMILALEKAPYDYILHIHESFFLAKPVDTLRIQKLIAIMKEFNAACMRFCPCPEPDLPFQNSKEVGLISIGAPYRVSMQVAVWRKDIFRSLLVEGEDAWEMELKGSRRSDALDSVPFMSVKIDPKTDGITSCPIYYFDPVVKGKWTQEGLALCAKEGISISFSKRRVYTWWDKVWKKSLIYNAYYNLRKRIGIQLKKNGLK